jgi:hypothetical protein
MNQGLGETPGPLSLLHALVATRSEPALGFNGVSGQGRQQAA